MSIYNRCQNCRNLNSLDEKVCKKCGHTLLTKNYYVRVMVNSKLITKAAGDKTSKAKPLELKIKSGQISSDNDLKNKQELNLTMFI